MLNRTIMRVSFLLLIIMGSITVPRNVSAGGVCGGTYIVEKGETYNSIAARCGTSASAIIAANPGVSEPLKTGQAITVPGITYNAPITDATASNINYTTYGPVNYTNIYLVQVNDTFSSIASRYGVSINALWAANPNI